MVPRNKRIDTISPTVVVGEDSQESVSDAASLSSSQGDFLVPVVEKKKRGRKKKNISEIVDDAMEVKAESRQSSQQKRWYIWNEVLPKKKNTADEEDKESNAKRKWKRGHKLTAIISATIGFLFVLSSLLGGAAYAHQAIYQNKIFPGVMVWGVDVGGKSVTEVQEIITQKARDYNVVIKGPDQDYKATISDLGIVFNTDTMALSAYSKGRSDVWWDDYLTRARLVATEIPWQPWQRFVRSSDLAIVPSYTVNQDKLNAYLTKVSDNIQIKAQDSEVTVVGSTTQIKPAIYGRTVQQDKLKQSVLASIASMKTGKIEVQTISSKPAIVDKAAEEVVIQAKNVMSRPVVLTYGGFEYRPNQDTVGSWLTFSKQSGDSKYTLVVDKAKMSSYFSFLESKINIPSVQRIVRVENGVTQTESRAGVDGLLVDTGLLGNQISVALPVQTSVKLAIPTYVDKFKTKYENVVIADWDKYIDVNLTTQTMMACERGGVNCRQWKITSGKDGTATPTGTFLILGRSADFYMTGGTPGVDYYKVWVDRATWFTSQGHAIHDAHWRNGSFGGQDYHWNGSHGCLNSPDEAADFVYDWGTIGTPVVIHY